MKQYTQQQIEKRRKYRRQWYQRLKAEGRCTWCKKESEIREDGRRRTKCKACTEMIGKTYLCRMNRLYKKIKKYREIIDKQQIVIVQLKGELNALRSNPFRSNYCDANIGGDYSNRKSDNQSNSTRSDSHNR